MKASYMVTLEPKWDWAPLARVFRVYMKTDAVDASLAK